MLFDQRISKRSLSLSLAELHTRNGTPSATESHHIYMSEIVAQFLSNVGV